MHVAKQLRSENLNITLQGNSATLDELFPESHRYDRFGILVNEPYGGLGASLLIQAAIVQFYDILPERRVEDPIYPEIYMFHLDGKFGDHSSFDFWPPRKEVFLKVDVPADILSALVDRGITRLAIPDVKPGRFHDLQDAASTWADLSAAKNLFASSFVYSANATTQAADLLLESDHDSFEQNAEWTLDTDIIVDRYKENPDNIIRPGPTIGVDIDRWVHALEARDVEVDDEYAKSLLRRRRIVENERLVRRESFRRIDLEETFRLLAGL